MKRTFCSAVFKSLFPAQSFIWKGVHDLFHFFSEIEIKKKMEIKCIEKCISREAYVIPFILGLLANSIMRIYRFWAGKK
jgi:hypothetical protein